LCSGEFCQKRVSHPVKVRLAAIPSLAHRAALMRPVPKLVQKAGRPNSNRCDTDPDAKRRIHADDYPANASADYSQRNEIGKQCVNHDLPSFASRQLLVP
jgi:hypothetical protein